MALYKCDTCPSLSVGPEGGSCTACHLAGRGSDTTYGYMWVFSDKYIGKLLLCQACGPEYKESRWMLWSRKDSSKCYACDAWL